MRVRTGARQDHPRGCGEHRTRRCWPAQHSGSSPRMRGALTDNADNRMMIRIIPADAGSTAGLHQAAHCKGDHPRGCGEHAGLGCGA